MIRPTYKILLEENAILWQARSVHENFRLFKYKWRVYSMASPYEGREFFKNTRELSTFEAMKIVEDLITSREPGIVYNRRLPRVTTPMILNRDSPYWKNAEWAADYELDTDTPWNGHK